MSRHHRHQSSLEGIIDFSSPCTLDERQRSIAKSQFYDIIDHFNAAEANNSNSDGSYNRPRLIQLTYEYAISKESRDILLDAFSRTLQLPLDSAHGVDLTDTQVEAKVGVKVAGFADYLLDNFFLPLKASTKKTPQPSPAYHSAVLSAQGDPQTFVGTPARLSTLRGRCLVRDRFRCVISRAFDMDTASKRLREDDNACDEDGQLLKQQVHFDTLEVAHILPHSLTKASPDSQLDASREAAFAILNMFDYNVAHLINGIEIDRPLNAITLSHRLHMAFGGFEVFFEPIDNEPPHTYRIDTFLPRPILGGLLPVTRTLFLTETRTVEPPSPRLLAVHRAIAHILHLSGAGLYIDRILREIEEQETKADGSSNLARFVNLRLNKWWDGTVNA